MQQTGVARNRIQGKVENQNDNKLDLYGNFILY
jgi:hypothetical protein